MDDKMGRAQSHRQGGPRLICLVTQNRPSAFRYPIDVIGGPNGDSKLLRQTVGRQRMVIRQAELFSKLDRSPLTLRFEPSSECHLVSSTDGSTCQIVTATHYRRGGQKRRCYRIEETGGLVRLSKASLAGSELLGSAKSEASPVLAEFFAGNDS